MTTRLLPGLIGAAALAAILPAAVPVQAADLGEAYKGRTVTVVIGFGVGGTYGLYSTAIARHMPKHLPGHPNIIVQSMPGAGGIKASNYAYNVMPKDGYN